MVTSLVVFGIALVGALALAAIATLRFAVYGAYGFPQRALETQRPAPVPAQSRIAA
jgi:hypothetical protein